MKKLLVKMIAAVFLLCSANIPAFADELKSSEPKAGITPDSIFYFIDRAVENIQLSLEKNPQQKIIILAYISGERMAEAKAMADENKDNLSVKAVDDSQQAQNKAEDLIKTQQEAVQNKDTDGQKKLDEAISRLDEQSKNSVEKLNELLKKVPETAKPAIQKAIDNQTILKSVLENYMKAKQAVEESKDKVAELEKAFSDAKTSNDTAKIADIQAQLDKANADYMAAEQNLETNRHSFKDIRNQIKKDFKDAKKEIQKLKKEDKKTVIVETNKSIDEVKAEAEKIEAETGTSVKIMVINDKKLGNGKVRGKKDKARGDNNNEGKDE